ncbi:hypothetical protein KEM09_21555 [Carboxylicivirga mesophila]|uniref:Uncharacterized protein n=1 Tax=Carboxylicivirga mesophila TaxID=1166478 RepID=A0ABS5KG83_9BACT|nr:hypothetical protein [Carboxylicivirga mesophila]MBS2214010.1 hypothetical protein [Carboxylicivirga mesophila]
MGNNYFIFTEKQSKIELERFHICTWEFKNNSALIEFGGEIKNAFDLNQEEIILKFYIPWISNNHVINDLYDKLKESENSRFIFNDSVSGHVFLDGGQKRNGVIQKFETRNPLCIIPIESSLNHSEKIVTVKINLRNLKKLNKIDDTSLYFRFYIEPKINFLSTRKTGISRSTIIYDLKLNERRNLPEEADIDLEELRLCRINSCFAFNILPNSYDLTFFDTSTLRNIRTLEFDSFKKYLGDNRVKKDELVVVFNKKKGQDSYAFFSIFSKERIGPGQFALAVLVNLVCAILLLIPTIREKYHASFFSKELWQNLPFEVYLSIFIGLLIVGYFTWPRIVSTFISLRSTKTKK